MRIAAFDDLHTEFSPWTIPVLDADVIVLAGDIATTPTNYRAFVETMHATNRGAQVVGVLGNHEAYGHELTGLVAKYTAAVADLEYIHLLHNSSTLINGWTFLGATLWTDLSHPDHALYAGTRMNDYRKIRFLAGTNYRRLTPRDTTRAHIQSVHFLRNSMEALGDNSKTVVITHHAPSWQSWPADGFSGREGLEAAYCARLDHLIEAQQPAVWLHGHVHRTCHYRIGQTLVRNNPRGYEPFELNPDFDPTLVVDTGRLDTVQTRTVAGLG